MKRAIVLAVLALCPARSAAATPPDRSAPPAPGPAPAFRMPPVERYQLDNGLRILLVESHEVPVVEVDLIVRSGATSDPADTPGLASFTAAMLDEGAGTRDALAIADDIEFLGADLDASASWEFSSVTLHVPVARLEPALAIMADVVLRPGFPSKEFDRLRTERLTTLLQWRDDPRTLATTVLRREVFSPAERLGVPLLGTEASLRSMLPAGLADFHRTHYRPDNAALIIVGDVTAASIMSTVREAFGAWPAGAGSPVLPPCPPPTGPTSVIIVDRPGAQQTEVRIGSLGPARGTPEYHALTVLNTILGGATTSRLNINLRETHGYTYGAGSRFEMYRRTGLFVAAASVQTAVTDSAVIEFLREIRRIHEPVSPDELARASGYVALSFPSGFETSQQIAGRLTELYVHDLPDAYYDGYTDAIMKVRLEDVGRVASVIDAQRIVIVLVGDAAAIAEKIRALGLGEVRSITVTDVLGEPPKI